MPTEAELKDAAGGICYRVEQTAKCADELIEERARVLAGEPGLPTHVHNAFLESWLVNCRVLADFLQRRSGNHGYVVAMDYDKTWEPVSNVGRLFGRISETAAHANYIGKPEWEVGSDTRTIVGGIVTFTRRLKETTPNRALWFSPTVDAVTQGSGA